MRVFESKKKNYAYLIYRLLKPLCDPVLFFHGLLGYIWYLRDFVAYNKLASSSNKATVGLNLYPMLTDKVNFTPFDAHYFFQQLWVFENVLKKMPKEHVDIASTYEMSGYISKLTKTKFIDIRPIDTKLKNLKIVKGSILSLPLKSNSVYSLSCLHTIEHIGLGRYGDPIDPDGLKKACYELRRVLAKGGTLYLSTPISRERICFNAHRITSPLSILSYFSGLKLVSFNVVDDAGNFIRNAKIKNYLELNYGCGLFEFKKIK